jgi:hypothetical protein
VIHDQSKIDCEMLILNADGSRAETNDDQLAKKLQQLQKEFGQPGYLWTLQQLLHPILLWFIVLPLYYFLDLGKILLVLSQWVGVLAVK